MIKNHEWLMTPNNGCSFEGRSVKSANLAAEECKLPELGKKVLSPFLVLRILKRPMKLKAF